MKILDNETGLVFPKTSLVCPVADLSPIRISGVDDPIASFRKSDPSIASMHLVGDKFCEGWKSRAGRTRLVTEISRKLTGANFLLGPEESLRIESILCAALNGLSKKEKDRLKTVASKALVDRFKSCQYEDFSPGCLRDSVYAEIDFWRSENADTGLTNYLFLPQLSVPEYFELTNYGYEIGVCTFDTGDEKFIAVSHGDESCAFRGDIDIFGKSNIHSHTMEDVIYLSGFLMELEEGEYAICSDISVLVNSLIFLNQNFGVTSISRDGEIRSLALFPKEIEEEGLNFIKKAFNNDTDLIDFVRPRIAERMSDLADNERSGYSRALYAAKNIRDISLEHHSQSTKDAIKALKKLGVIHSSENEDFRV